MPANPLATTVPANSTFTFDHYVIEDSGIHLTFLCPNPGPGNNSYWTIFLTDAEVASITNLASAGALVTTKLQRQIRATGVSTKLDQLIGQSVTI